MAPRFVNTLLVALASSVVLVGAQVPTPGQSDPNAICPVALNDQIQACRAQVYAVETALPQGPCWSSDWPCICNVQQGLLDCYAPCPGNTPQTDIDYNNANCAGQNGASNAAAVPGGAPYVGGALTTTGSALATTTTGVTSISSTTVAAATTTASTTAAPDSTTITSSGSTTTIPLSGTTGTSSNTASSARATPSQSRSGNVFDGQNGGAAAMRKKAQQGSLQAGLSLGLLSVLLLVRL